MTSEPRPISPFGAFARGLARLLLALIVIGAIAAAFAYALPLVYRELVLPVRDTSARLDALSQQIASDRAAMNEQLQAVQARLNQLETDRAAADTRTADLQSSLDSLRADMDKLQSALTRLDQLEKSLQALDGSQSQTAAQLATLETSLRAPGGQIVSLKREVQILKAMNLLTRAEVNLAQNNFGLAREDVTEARAVLLALRDTLASADQPAVDLWIARLDLALTNLPGFPLIASNDLQAAYQLLAAGVLPPPPTPAPLEASATATITATATVTATPDLSATPTPAETETPTPTAAP